MYLANCTRPNIAFVVNLLAGHSAAPTKRHWTGVKHILRYVNGTRDLGLFSKGAQIQIWLDTLTLDIYLIPIMADHKEALCFYTMEQPFRGSLPNKLW